MPTEVKQINLYGESWFFNSTFQMDQWCNCIARVLKIHIWKIYIYVKIIWNEQVSLIEKHFLKYSVGIITSSI